MSRAIVLVGVSRTSSVDFPALAGVEDAIQEMSQWAEAQAISHIIKVTDVGVGSVGEVTIELISKAISELLSRVGFLQQLIIYFSGHGIVNAFNEYLLLSGAPSNANEAINVTGSVALAQTWKIPHVVFFSDACRSMGATVQIGRITGSQIIPNEPMPGPEKAVDVFYATRLGTPALEVIDGERYVAVYTRVLVKALKGEEPAAIDDGYVRPRPLKEWLAEAVPRYLNSKNLSALISQSPDARISSGDKDWISKCNPPDSPTPSDSGQGVPANTSTSRSAGDRRGSANMPLSQRELRSGASAGPAIQPAKAAEMLLSAVLGNNQSEAAFAKLALEPILRERARAPIGEHTESDPVPLGLVNGSSSGLQITGARVQEATCTIGPVIHFASVANHTLVVESDEGQGQIFIRFEDGSGVLLPVLRGHVGIVRLEKGVLNSVHYESSNPSEAERSRHEFEDLRFAMRKAVTLGSLALDVKTALNLARRLHDARFIDPALAVYAVYAFQAIGRLRTIVDVRTELIEKQELRLFDVELLARKGDEVDTLSLVPPSLGPTPLLSQGWAFVDALLPKYPDHLKQLRQHVGQSLWSHYDREGAAILETWVRQSAAGQNHYSRA